MEYLKIDELAEILRLSVSTIYKYTSKKKIPYIKIGKNLLFDKENIVNWIEKRKIEVI